MSKQRLVSVTFKDNAGPLAGYASVGKSTGAVESIALAQLLPDGTWVAVDKQRGDGFGIVRREGPTSQRAYFVPMSNVACVAYEAVADRKE